MREHANPGDTWSPGPRPVFAVTNTPPESPAEITAEIPPVSVTANTNTPAARHEHANMPMSVPANPRPEITAPWMAAHHEHANMPLGSLPPAPEVREHESANPLLRRPSLLELIGLTEDRRLTGAGYVATRVRGLRWRYETAEQEAARMARRRWEHELRGRVREFRRRIDSFKVAVAPLLGFAQWDQVSVSVPVEYDSTATRTGDVIVRRGETRLREETDPSDMPEVPPIRLTLPDGFTPAAKAAVSGLVKDYFGGEWGSRFELTAHPHYALFWREREKPAPPKMVRWHPTDDPYVMHIGHDGEKERFISLLTDAPHCGVSAGSGKGKTTTLLNYVQHARSHGDLVDIIDLKEDSFDEATAVRKKNRFNVDIFENVSGIRVHRDVKSAVAALAEFYVSVKSMRIARENGYDMSTVPRRYLIIDEFGSFVGSADFWWKYGLQQKGSTPFRAWFHQILMQGRSKDHRVVVGAHDYDRETFGSTSVRNLIGFKMLIRDNLLNSYIKAFGQGIKRIKINDSIHGRAMAQELPGSPVFELELAYTPPTECLEFLQQCTEAPEWFDAGEMAPWISDESIARSHEEMYVGPFLPGGEFVTQGEIEAGGSGGNPPPVLGAQPASGLRVALTESELREREDAEVLTQREILERGYLMPLLREAEARQPGRTPDELLRAALKTMRNDRDRGKFPEAVGEGVKGKLYRVGDVREWEQNRSNKMQLDTASDDDSGESESETRGA